MSRNKFGFFPSKAGEALGAVLTLKGTPSDKDTGSHKEAEEEEKYRI